MNDKTKAIVEQTNNALPAHLQQGKKASFGNVDQNDLIIPRIKLLQATSPEVVDFADRGAVVGQFWHTLAEQPLGTKLNFIPLVLKKELVLWAPRGDDRGVLARSSNLKDWDAGFANLEFEVNIKNAGKVRYYTRDNVAESGLAEFGSYIPNNPDSRPAASLTYRMMFLFPDFMDLSPAIVINTRGAVRAAKGLISKIEMKPVDHYGQLYSMTSRDEPSDEGSYKAFVYSSEGYADEGLYNKAKDMYNRFVDVDWKTNEANDEEGGSGGKGNNAPSTSDKF